MTFGHVIYNFVYPRIIHSIPFCLDCITEEWTSVTHVAELGCMRMVNALAEALFLLLLIESVIGKHGDRRGDDGKEQASNDGSVSNVEARSVL